MTRKDHIRPIHTDFEKLMLSKRWDDLTPEERSEMEGLVTGRREYDQMRGTLLAIRQSEDAAMMQKADPATRAKLMEAFVKEGEWWKEPPSKGKRILLRRKRIWITTAAAAAMLLVIGSVVWVLFSDTSGKLVHPKVEVASHTPEHGKTISIDPSSAGGMSTDNGISVPGANEDIITDQDVDLFDVMFPEEKGVAYAGKTKDRVMDTVHSPAMMADEVVVSNATSPQVTTTFNTREQVADIQMQKMIVSERSVYQKGGASVKKPAVILSRPLSKDLALTGVLFACF